MDRYGRHDLLPRAVPGASMQSCISALASSRTRSRPLEPSISCRPSKLTSCSPWLVPCGRMLPASRSRPATSGLDVKAATLGAFSAQLDQRNQVTHTLPCHSDRDRQRSDRKPVSATAPIRPRPPRMANLCQPPLCSNGAASTPHSRTQDKIADFDDHMADLTKDWRNSWVEGA